MAVSNRAPGICDNCGFRYKLIQLRFTSYNTRVCPSCWDGRFDKVNSPLNKPAYIPEDPMLKDPRPPANTDRNVSWEAATAKWEDNTDYWNLATATGSC